MNREVLRANDLSPAIAALRQNLNDPRQLVSFGPIDHRFAYYYRDFIGEYDWPKTAGEVPGGARFFCFQHHLGDTAEVRIDGRGMYWGTTSGTLPFEWEQVARIPCDRNIRDVPQVSVVVGRIVEPAERFARQDMSSHLRPVTGAVK